MMNSLTKLELKKIRSNKAVKIACSLIILYVVFALIGTVRSGYHFRLNSSLNGNDELTGLEAIKQKKLDVKKVEGYLDDQKVKEVISYKQQLRSNKDNVLPDGSLNDVAWGKYWIPYLDIGHLFGIAYSDLHTADYTIIDKLTPDDSKDFYSNRTKKISDYLNLHYDYPKFDKKDAEAIRSVSKTLQTPLYYEYSDGWSELMQNFTHLNVCIILILCFSVCNVFTEDISNGMVLVVLPTINGKSKLVSSKIKASIIFSSITYLVVNMLFSISLLSFYGFSGWNTPIQIQSHYWLSIYNFKFYEAYIMALIIGLSVCIFMVLLTLLVSNILKKAFLTISVVSCLLLIPLLVSTEKLTKIPNNLIELLPIKALNVKFTLTQLSMYNIFGAEVLRGYVTPVVLLIASAIFVPFIIKLYNRQQA